MKKQTWCIHTLMLAVTMAPMFIVSIAATVLYSNQARADELVVGDIAMPGIKVTGFHNGKIIYMMNGRESSRDFEEMRLHLDSIPALKTAEDDVDAKKYDEAMTQFQTALVEADKDWQRVWINYRRMVVFDSQGRFTEACQAWTAIVTESDDSIWADHIPTCSPDHPDKEVFDEALMFMRNARGRVKRKAVVDSLDALIKFVSDEAARPAPLFGAKSSTSSDSDKSTKTSSNDADHDHSTDKVPDVSITDPYAPNVIDTLIGKGQFDEARKAIEKLVAAPKTYPIDRLLFQYGEVLAQSGDNKEAAVRFMQCAILFEDGGFAGRSLIETAKLYAGPLKDTAIANRLVDRAIEYGKDRNDSYTLTQATKLKQSLTQK